MPDGLSAVLISSWLNLLRTGTAAVNPVATYVQLHTGSPGPSGTSAVSAGSMAREQAAFAASSGGGALSLASAVGGWTNTGPEESVTDVSVWTAATGGAFLFSTVLPTPMTWAAGDTMTLTSIVLALAPLAS